MEQQQVVRDAEEYLQRVVAEVMAPHPAECVLCYVTRMIGEHGCDETLRWTGRFRELRSPRATALEARMQAVGGFCDCEILSNGYRLRREHLERDIHTDELREPDRPPNCGGVGRLDSTKPCTVWEPRRRRSPGCW